MDATEWATALGAIPTEASTAVTAALPIGIGVFVLTLGIGLVLRVLGKFGVRK